MNNERPPKLSDRMLGIMFFLVALMFFRVGWTIWGLAGEYGWAPVLTTVVLDFMIAIGIAHILTSSPRLKLGDSEI